jgi:flagellar protein FliO/FliZ
MRTLPAIFRTVAAALLACLLTAPVALAADTGEHTKLDLGNDSSSSSASSHVSSGGSIVRTIAGLLIVLAVIYGITWVLKQVKASKATAASGNSLEQIASLPLGPNRALHLVRAGDEVVLIGAAEHGVTPIRRFSEAEALEMGLIEGPAPATLATLQDEAPAPAKPKGLMELLRSKTVIR